MGDELVQGVIETIDKANEQRLILSQLMDSIAAAKKQVTNSAEESSQLLKSHFKELQDDINTALEKRMKELLSEVHRVESTALTPLIESEKMIKDHIDIASKTLLDGKRLLSSDHDTHESEMKEFRNNDISSVPEVPKLSDVACIVLDLPASGAQSLSECLADYGQVMAKAPVQIIKIEERPGGMMLKWAEIEDEASLGLTEFRLQSSVVDDVCRDAGAPNALRFQNIYQGNLTSFNVRGLSLNTVYKFRVCGRAEGTDHWSPWSIPSEASTKLPHYEWSSDTPGYEVSQKNKVGCSCSTNKETQVPLFSSINSFTCGHCITFTVLADAPSTNSKDGIGLAVNNGQTTDFSKMGTIFMNCEGAVYQDGSEKLTRLPALRRGSTLIFDTEMLLQDKVRVTVEVDEKIVTFDWTVSSNTTSDAGLGGLLGAAAIQENPKIYFFMSFENQGWKVLVE